jgi:DNA-binding GntR family transcriptional regulator
VFEIHRRQLDAMWARDKDLLEAALDHHFHFLEDRLPKSLGRPWAELFAEPRPKGSP